MNSPGIQYCTNNLQISSLYNVFTCPQENCPGGGASEYQHDASSFSEIFTVKRSWAGTNSGFNCKIIFSTQPGLNGKSIVEIKQADNVSTLTMYLQPNKN